MRTLLKIFSSYNMKMIVLRRYSMLSVAKKEKM